MNLKILAEKGKHLYEVVFIAEKNKLYSSDLKAFIQLCLKEVEFRPKYEGLQLTPFYRRFAVDQNGTAVSNLGPKVESFLKTIVSLAQFSYSTFWDLGLTLPKNTFRLKDLGMASTLIVFEGVFLIFGGLENSIESVEAIKKVELFSINYV